MPIRTKVKIATIATKPASLLLKPKIKGAFEEAEATSSGFSDISGEISGETEAIGVISVGVRTIEGVGVGEKLGVREDVGVGVVRKILGGILNILIVGVGVTVGKENSRGGLKMVTAATFLELMVKTTKRKREKINN